MLAGHPLYLGWETGPRKTHRCTGLSKHGSHGLEMCVTSWSVRRAPLWCSALLGWGRCALVWWAVQRRGSAVQFVRTICAHRAYGAICVLLSLCMHPRRGCALPNGFHAFPVGAQCLGGSLGRAADLPAALTPCQVPSSIWMSVSQYNSTRASIRYVANNHSCVVQ